MYAAKSYIHTQLVLASFPPPGSATPPHLSLLMKTFQTLFPPLSPKTLSLSSARRVVLVSYNAERGTVNFRHYLITVKPYGVSKRVRKVLEGAAAKASAASASGLLNLGSEKDVADFLLRKKGEPGPSSDGYESAASSASSIGGDDVDAIDLADDYVGRNNKKGQRRAVRLDEIGPRMELRLIKIAEGVPGKEGNVIYHEFGKPCWGSVILCSSLTCCTVKKAKAEIAAQKAEHAAKEMLRKQRREEQEKNVERKKKLAKPKGDEDEEYGEEDEDDVHLQDEETREKYKDGGWDDEEEINEGEENESDEDEASESSEDEDVQRPPPKKVKFKSKG